MLMKTNKVTEDERTPAANGEPRENGKTHRRTAGGAGSFAVGRGFAAKIAEFQAVQVFSFDCCALRFDLLMSIRPAKDGNARAARRMVTSGDAHREEPSCEHRNGSVAAPI